MKFLLKPVVTAGLVLMAASPLASAPAAAQELKTIGVVNLQYVMGQSNAYKTGEQQRPVTYKAQIDQAQTRTSQLKAQLQPMADKLQADSKLPNANRQQLQQQYDTIQQLSQQGQREIDQIMQPVVFSQQYVQEQIQEKLQQAVDNAAQKKGLSLSISSDAVFHAGPTYDVSQAVIDELNALLPVAQLVPPPGWLPRELREQQAAQQAAQGQAPAAAPAATKKPATPAGRPATGR